MNIFLVLMFFLTACVSTSPPKKAEVKSQVPTLPQVKKPFISPEVLKYCEEIDQKFAQYNWEKPHCQKAKWHHLINSVLNRPLIWKVFAKEHKPTNNITMIFCGVHGDEITPVKFCFDIIDDFIKNPMNLKGHTLIVAPIISPDSFFKKSPTRTNANGIDVNRNFPTNDWNDKALTTWKNHYGRDPRRFPGHKALSEPETVFQVNLIKKYRPHKIISVHAPLTLLDYDGPRLAGKTVVSLGEKLLKTMSKKAYNYKIKNYPFFPGSLGNYSGNERHIPTYTLELPNSDPRRSKEFWNIFKLAIRSSVTTDFRESVVGKPLPKKAE